MDALIAEKVMGDTRKPLCLSSSIIGDNGVDFPFYPPYSTQIASAWEVVEKMRNAGFWLCLDSMVNLQADHVFRCIFRDGGIMHGGEEKTAPHAICLAALKAKGVEV